MPNRQEPYVLSADAIFRPASSQAKKRRGPISFDMAHWGYVKPRATFPDR